MANYGRGWGDGYGGQSAEAQASYQDQQDNEAGQNQNTTRRLARIKEVRVEVEATLSGLSPRMRGLLAEYFKTNNT